MKRKMQAKLSLNRETLRSLDSEKLTGVLGGVTANTRFCPTGYLACGTETSDYCNTSGGCP